MYVVTFYSFKGGVGRTMAMVNVAAELAKRGRRILMVDFDLEAPGLSDFGLINTKEKTPGLVEFITEYQTSGVVPRVNNFIYQSLKYPETGDRLWIMPAGCQNGDYQSLFTTINWQTLYERDSGYLLMEDLRAQWQSAISPDYVFIDSRTGYTDIAGICTRQLPDAVCLVFVPNRQNLTGLTKITAEIKAQTAAPDLRHPKLHFVASNIPTLDDDEEVLERALGNFSRQLEYLQPSAIIHHYNSFALINEAVFTLEYPKNPLAFEYKSLADAITRENLHDRVTAIEISNSIAHRAITGNAQRSGKEIDEQLSKLENNFSADAEVLFSLSRARRSLGNLEESEILLDSAIGNGLNTPRGYLDRAINRINHPDGQDSNAIWDDLQKILRMTSVSPSDLLWTVKLALRIGHDSVSEILQFPAIQGLNSKDIAYLAHELLDSANTVELSVEFLLTAIAQKRMEKADLEDGLNVLAMGSIALGRLGPAIDAISQTVAAQTGEMEVSTLFNLGMAKYWKGEKDAVACFNEVINTLSMESATTNANHLQCLSFAAFAVGDNTKANLALEKAKTRIAEQSGPTFSCWRYLEVSPKQFREDLNEMEQLYNGANLQPIFCRALFPNRKPE